MHSYCYNFYMFGNWDIPLRTHYKGCNVQRVSIASFKMAEFGEG